MTHFKKDNLKSVNSLQIQQQFKIQNYYGTHKKFKTQLRNKRFKKIYNFLIKNVPSQSNYLPLYYQDLLISIIKILKGSLYFKESNPNQFLEHFTNKGLEILLKLYEVLLVDKYYLQNKIANQNLSKNMSYFFTLTIDFINNLTLCLGINNLNYHAQKIFTYGYIFVHNILISSTSNVRLLRKCIQFLISYANFQRNSGKFQNSLTISGKALQIQINEIYILNYLQSFKKKGTKIKSKQIRALLRLKSIYIGLAISYERIGKMQRIYDVLNQGILIQKIVYPKNKHKSNQTQLIKKYKQYKDQYNELLYICNIYFDKDQLFKLQFPTIHNQINKQDPNQQKHNTNLHNEKGDRKNNKNNLINDKNIKQVVRQSILSNKSLLTSNNVIKLNDDRILLFGEHFWGRNKNNSVKTSKDEQVNKKTINNSFLNDLTSKLSKKYAKNDITLLKKHGQRNLFQKFRNKRQIEQPIPYQQVCQNIQNLIKIDQQCTNKFQKQFLKLKLKKSTQLDYKFQLMCSKQMESNQQSVITPINSKNIIRKSNIQQINLKGINLFKSIILAHRQQFGIIKTQLFTVQKKKQNIEDLLCQQFYKCKQLARNQAERNINFYLEEYNQTIKITKKLKKKDRILSIKNYNEIELIPKQQQTIKRSNSQWSDFKKL